VQQLQFINKRIIEHLRSNFAAVRKKSKPTILENILITDYAAEGKALARIEGKVIFVSGAVPGDTVDILLTKSKSDWAEGRAIKIKEYSQERVEPFCKHFGVCGGCKWQMLPYKKQLEYKQQEAEQNLRRISKLDLPPILPIIGCDSTIHYRNKLEFTFSNKQYLTELPNPALPIQEARGLGYHAPRIFDKVIDIHECYLMDDVNNKIRNTLRVFALENEYSFYDARQHTGWLRNVIIRLCSTGELMVNLVLNYEDEVERKKILDHLLQKVPSISTLLFTINAKWNDSIHDLQPQVYFGSGYALEKLDTGIDGESFHYKISAKSFFQTNTSQAQKLYAITRDFAGLTGNENVYDLYCGTGSIGIFLSKQARKIVGIEVIEEAIEDAKENAALNNISHAEFIAGDVIKICNDEFFKQHGRPDVVITDPPRAGMHEKLVNKLLQIEAPVIVYVSCNTATQARDIGLLGVKYNVEKIQPVDMFPHTHHIECVVLLKLK
jgi:23S rRNA (uracil1939-C5)-methyltransferase